MAREVAAALSGGTQTVVIDGGEPASVTCDRTIVRRILENLVSNAIKHTPPRTAVSVSAIRELTSVRIRVRDNGQGVPKEARERIFEKFGAVQTPGAARYHSVGLGLAFCKLAVQAHGGTIGVEDGDTGGSVFWFDLPAVR